MLTLPPQLSVAVALKSTTAEHCPRSLYTTVSAGQTMAGGWLSLTATVCVQLLVLPQASVAVQVIVVTPTGYGSLRSFGGSPSLLSLRLKETVGVPAQLSVAVAIPGWPSGNFAVQAPGSVFAVMFAGQVMVGFTSS